MKIGPRYKKARRLGASIFEKTQTAKFSAHLTKRKANPEGRRAKTDYGNLLLGKQPGSSNLRYKRATIQKSCEQRYC